MSCPRNILFLTHRVPFPPNKGDKIRTFHQIEYLASRHNVFCACFVDSQEDWRHAETLRHWCKGVAAIPWGRIQGSCRALRGLLTGANMTCAAYADSAMMVIVSDWCGRVTFDVVTAFSSSMAPYALAASAGRRILDLCDVDSQKWFDYANQLSGPLSPLYRTEGRRLRAFEHHCMAQFDATLVVSERERAILDPHRQNSRLHVISNGVDVPVDRARTPAMCGPVIGFIGALDYPPNVDGVGWFTESVWPMIRKRVPHARFNIVGRNMGRRIRRLRRIDGVELIGSVPEVAPHLGKMRVVVAPLRIARGVQNKILEALTLNRPVVSTSCAANGLDAVAESGILIADDASKFAELVTNLCENDQRCNDLGQQGHAYVLRRHQWETSLQAYEHVLLDSRGAAVFQKTAMHSHESRTFQAAETAT